MVDRLTPERRSALMKRVGGKNTTPEIAVRKLLHAMGYRFRLHYKKLPGSPDIVFPSRTKAIFVHGCFWHGHGCSKGRLPKSNVDFWAEKIDKNKARDESKERQLEETGWQPLVVWQCELKDTPGLEGKLKAFLG